MIFVRIVLAAAFIPAFVGLVRLSSARSRALRILMFTVLLAAVFLSILFPTVWSWFADSIGINSGLDLLTYTIALVLLTYMVYGISKFRQAESRLTVVARELALLKEKIKRKNWSVGWKKQIEFCVFSLIFFSFSLILSQSLSASFENASNVVSIVEYGSASGANLRNANLSNRNLSFIDLTGADLSGADLRGTVLMFATLTGVNLENADLSFSLLMGAKMNGANLRAARFYKSIMNNADLQHADASGALFSRAVLREANLSYMNVTNALFKDADLVSADFTATDRTTESLELP